MEAPRWSLTNPHYLNVEQLPDGTKVEWEHKETNTVNGRMVRKLFAVPMLLNPAERSDQNYPGQIVVAHRIEGAHSQPNDIIFLGEPTQEMEPLNDEAQAISDSLRDKWIHPIETMPANGGMNDREMAFFEKMMQVFSTGQPANAAVPKAEYDELKERLAKLEALLAAKVDAKVPERRV